MILLRKSESASGAFDLDSTPTNLIKRYHHRYLKALSRLQSEKRIQNLEAKIISSFVIKKP